MANARKFALQKIIKENNRWERVMNKAKKQRITEVNLTDSGGAFSLIYTIQKSLYSRGKEDVVFDYFSMGKFEKEEVIADIKKMGGDIYSADLRKNRLVAFLRTPWVFYKYCKENRVQTVHIHSDSAYILQLYSVPAKLAGVKHIIAHAHCSGMNGDYRRIKKMVHLMLRPFVALSSNVYLSCSDLATKWLYKKKLQKKVIFLKNGVNTSNFQFNEEKRKQFRQELEIDTDTIALAMVGDLGFQKNPLFICDVMKHLDKKYQLFLIGDGPCKSMVEKYVQDQGLSDKIVFLGRRNVSDVLNAMDIFVMPSKFEGLPVSGVEAQANGLPCVFSKTITRQVKLLKHSSFADIQSTKEWVKKIHSIKPDVEEREKAADSVRKSGFDIQDTADHLYEIYRSFK